MDTKYFDVIVAKEYEVKQQGGSAIKRTAWNRVGRAWTAKSGESLNFELYIFPNQRYVVKLQDREQTVVQENKFDDIPF